MFPTADPLIRLGCHFLRRVVRNLRNLRGIDQVNFSLAVFDMEFSAAREQPRIVEMVDVDLRSVQDMNGKSAKRLHTEPIA